METRAQIILDSVSPKGNRLTTIEVTLHRFVLAELNTHRVFSRNSASSRAIPFHKQVSLLENPALPVEWASEQRGMQGGEEIVQKDAANKIWLRARDHAIDCAQTLAELGVHKSIVNRLLEPFMWHTVIISATNWDGFWDQRCSPLAQPEIRVAAEAMCDAYSASEPFPLQYGQWHTPYIQPDESFEPEVRRAVSAARCARVSYLTHDGVRDVDKDILLFKRLVSADPPHWSPLEHVATPIDSATLGNFDGWKQLRHTKLKANDVI